MTDDFQLIYLPEFVLSGFLEDYIGLRFAINLQTKTNVNLSYFFQNGTKLNNKQNIAMSEMNYSTRERSRTYGKTPLLQLSNRCFIQP